jgi:hypothetical protein
MFGAAALWASLSYTFRWKGYRAVNVLVAVILALFVTALLLMGSEDIGGLRVSVPAFLVGMSLGVWSVVLAVCEPRDD